MANIDIPFTNGFHSLEYRIDPLRSSFIIKCKKFILTSGWMSCTIFFISVNLFLCVCLLVCARVSLLVYQKTLWTGLCDQGNMKSLIGHLSGKNCLSVLLLFMSGNVQPNPGHDTHANFTTPADFKERSGLGFLHLNTVFSQKWTRCLYGHILQMLMLLSCLNPGSAKLFQTIM